MSEEDEAINLDKISNSELEEKIRLMKLQIRGIQQIDSFTVHQEESALDHKDEEVLDDDDESSDFDDGRNLQKLIEQPPTVDDPRRFTNQHNVAVNQFQI